MNYLPHVIRWVQNEERRFDVYHNVLRKEALQQQQQQQQQKNKPQFYIWHPMFFFFFLISFRGTQKEEKRKFTQVAFMREVQVFGKFWPTPFSRAGEQKEISKFKQK